MGIGGDFPWKKQPEREVDHSPASGVEVNIGGAIPSSPICLHGLVLQ
jgi:hypothetical protein